MNNNDEKNLVLLHLEKIESKVDRLDSKVDRLDERVDSIDRTLAVNTESLREHMRRTALIEDDIKPIKKHVAMLEGGLKLVGIVSLVIGLLIGIATLLSRF